MVHLDLMDGQFVPNLTFGPGVIADLAPHAAIELDAHLMVEDADALLSPLAKAGVSRVAVHVEACTHLHRTLATIRDRGMSPGVAINPATPAIMIEDSLQWLDFVVVMSVNPGFGGQRFIPETLPKIRRIRHMIGDAPVDVTVDGGVGPDNAADLCAAGATTLVAGSSVFGRPDRGEAIRQLRIASEKGISA